MMKQFSTYRRAAMISAASAALMTGVGCSSEPDSVRVKTERSVAAPAATAEVHRSVRKGALSAPGDADKAQMRVYEPCNAEDAAQTYPGEMWQAAYAPARGWSEDRLEEAWRRARRGHYSAGMLVHQGRVISRFGAVDQPYEAASIRKSMLNAVVGQLVAEGRLDLDSRLGALGIEEDPPLNAIEKSATVRDLMMSRSGIYRPAAFTTGSQDDERPEPGTHRPGEHFFYNNWDFNALGTIVEKAGGAGIFELFRDRLAGPIGMQDYSLDDTRYERDSQSRHPAYLVRLSTRDRARLGLLYLRNGCWAGRQLVPADWVQTSVSPLTNREDELDYGYLWWSQEPIESQGLSGRIFMARGNGLQYVMVFPELDAVLVLTSDRNYPGWVNWMRSRMGFEPEFEDYSETLKLVLGARPRSSSGRAAES